MADRSDGDGFAATRAAPLLLPALRGGRSATAVAEPPIARAPCAVAPAAAGEPTAPAAYSESDSTTCLTSALRRARSSAKAMMASAYTAVADHSASRENEFSSTVSGYSLLRLPPTAGSA